MSISNWLNIFKRFLLGISDEVLLVLIVVLVGTAGFGLGRLSLSQDQKEPVRLYTEEGRVLLPTNTTEGRSGAQSATVLEGKSSETSREDGRVVASKNGTKYHLPWCSGAKRILEKNQVWFASEAEARARGYTPASNCPGIE